MSFRDMIAALFADPILVKGAVYLPQGGEPKTVSVMARQPDALTEFGEARFQSAISLFDVQAAEVPAPRVGDRLTVDGIGYLVQAEPMADRERLVWTLNVRPL